MDSIIPKQELVVIRKSKGEYFEGKWQDSQQENPGTIFYIKASVQGCNAQILQSLSEGQKVGETLTLYTENLLEVGDGVIFNSKEFLVIKITPWNHFKSTSHYQAIITRSITDAD